MKSLKDTRVTVIRSNVTRTPMNIINMSEYKYNIRT